MIITTSEENIIKINLENPSNLVINEGNRISHDLGNSNGIHYDFESKYFMVGSKTKPDVYIYDLKTLTVMSKIRIHKNNKV